MVAVSKVNDLNWLVQESQLDSAFPLNKGSMPIPMELSIYRFYVNFLPDVKGQIEQVGRYFFVLRRLVGTVSSCKDSPEAGLLNISSCLAPFLGVTSFTNVRNMILVTLCWTT
jgi:hypothetical protein